ncbi:GNAT family N-acetyltransferase [Roseibium litorale]|uniref:GNAT family N-acetyltransferase n=1 Tax=Roseibium litorale TaxID=2803841 RepID=A0ABR9CGT0_9HYPH|nr:GNAT family N-acetyltransferase [Roseibium litorale]MBD8889983.1 GNAT family N-acetyltransferase [Roseibium litorale]
MADLLIRPFSPSDSDGVWGMLQPVFSAGETYAVDPAISRDDALAYWLNGHEVFVVEEEGVLLGTYFLCPNQKGGGAHVCNCGFVTALAATGKGVARRMLAHSLEAAPQRGFRAMQFNFVVSTNTRAVAIWQSHGFDIVGRLPGAFNHPVQGYVDAFVMYRDLTGPAAQEK